MSNDNVAINAFVAFLNLIIKCFELHEKRLSAQVKNLEQKLENSKGSEQEKQKRANELEKANKELEAVQGALNYLNGLRDDAKAEIVANTMQEIVNAPNARENRWINGNGQLTQEGVNELTKRITDKALDSQQGLDEEQKESVRVQIQEASEKAVEISRKNIHEVTPETYQKLSDIYKENHDDDPTQYFSRNNIDAAINNVQKNDPILKELFVIHDKLTKGESVTFNDRTVQSDLIPARAADERAQ